jgi:hypothetical protein
LRNLIHSNRRFKDKSSMKSFEENPGQFNSLAPPCLDQFLAMVRLSPPSLRSFAVAGRLPGLAAHVPPFVAFVFFVLNIRSAPRS